MEKKYVLLGSVLLLGSLLCALDDDIVEDQQQQQTAMREEAQRQLVLGIKTANKQEFKQALRNGADINEPYGLDRATPLMMLIDELHRYSEVFSERQFMKIMYGLGLLRGGKTASWMVPYLFFHDKQTAPLTSNAKKAKKGVSSPPTLSSVHAEEYKNNYLYYAIMAFAGYEISSGLYHTFYYYMQRSTLYHKIDQLCAILEMMLNSLDLNVKAVDILGRTVYDRMAQYRWYSSRVQKLITLLERRAKLSQ